MGLFDSIFNKNKDIKFNNQTLRAAIKKWLKNPKKATSKYRHISSWDTSKVTDMSEMFKGSHAFNEDIGSWDTSGVTNMESMFSNTWNFNQTIGDWDVSSVTEMSFMFSDTENFNQPIDKWDVSSVTDIIFMFSGAKAFNQPISKWNVSNVTNMQQMFYQAISFNQPIGSWDVNKVTNMERMFHGATSFNQPIGNWDVSNVTEMIMMFYGAKAFNQALENWSLTVVGNSYIAHELERKKRYELAIEHYSIAIEIEPNNTMLYKNRSMAKEKLGEFESALKDWSKAMENANNNPSEEFLESIFQRGCLKEKVKDYEGAIKDFTKAIKLYQQRIKRLNSGDEKLHWSRKSWKIVEDIQSSIDKCKVKIEDAKGQIGMKIKNKK